MSTVQSMTGFATVPIAVQLERGAEITGTITIKSVNGRFFEAVCKMPSMLGTLEHAIMQHARERLVRGSVTVQVFITNAVALKGLTLSRSLVQTHLDAAQVLRDDFGLTGELRVSDMLQLPSIFETSDEGLDETARAALLEHVERACTLLIAMREREGAALAQDIIARLATITAATDELAPRAAAVAQQKKAEFLELMRQAFEGSPEEIQAGRVAALYSQLDKLDTHEEIVRLRAHVAACIEVLTGREPLRGKKLDFLAQELAREANTLSAKLADVTVVNQIMTLKSEIERIREQVQNLV